MKPIFFLFFSIIMPLFASSYYCKTEPIDVYTITSEVSGKVIFVDENGIGKKLGNTPFILIDKQIDEADLAAVKKKRASLLKMIQADKAIAANLQESIKRKEQNYNSIKTLSVKSKTQKDAVFFDLIASKNRLLSTKKEIENFISQEAQLQAQQIHLEKSISDKTITAPNLVLYELYVKKNDVATPGKPLAKVVDISKAILTIYVDAKTLQDIKNKTIYINDKKTAYKVDRVVPIADSTDISRYKVQIITKAPKIFSKLVKVELK